MIKISKRGKAMGKLTNLKIKNANLRVKLIN